MRQRAINRLPQPLALGLYNYQIEDPVQSADELAELISAFIEYLAVVALMDYFDGHENPEYNAANNNLNGWVVSQLLFGKVEAGLWARWTQIAIQHTTKPVFPCLKDYLSLSNLDDSTSHLSRLLRFRNDVMHGGFVAPLPKIQAAEALLTDLFDSLEPLWSHNLLACIDPIEDTWIHCTNLQSSAAVAPRINRKMWRGTGSIVLANSDGEAILALHPGCTVDPKSHEFHHQHHWKHAYSDWVERTPSLRDFYERYQRERDGRFDDSIWHEKLNQNLMPVGYLDRTSDQILLINSLEASTTHLYGSPKEGKSTFVKHTLDEASHSYSVYPIGVNSLQMDPNVLIRWLKIKSEEQESNHILIIDNIHHLGQGIYSGQSCKQVFELAAKIPNPVIFISERQCPFHIPADQSIVLNPWTVEESSMWPKDIRPIRENAGYAPCVVDCETGWSKYTNDMETIFQQTPLSKICLSGLIDGPLTLLELATNIQVFTPKVEHILSQMGNWVFQQQSTSRNHKETVFDLHPAMRLLLQRKQEVANV